MSETLSPDQMIRYTLVVERPHRHELDADGNTFWDSNPDSSPEHNFMSDLGLDNLLTGDALDLWEGGRVVSIEREVVKPDPDEVLNMLIVDVAALGGEDANDVDFNALMANIKLAKEYADDPLCAIDDEVRDELRTHVAKAKEAIGL